MKGYKYIGDDVEIYDSEKEAEIDINANRHKPEWILVGQKLYSKDW